MTPDEISAGCNAIVALAATTAAFVATRGLRTWKDQLAGQADYDLARRALLATYRLRDEITQVRNPAIFPAEQSKALQAAGLSGDPTQHPERLHLVYERRFGSLLAALSNLEAEALEAEVLWGRDLQVALSEFKPSIFELRLAIERYLAWDTDRHAHAFKDDAEERKILDYVHNPSFYDRPDKFGGKIQAIVAKVESIVKPHLPHRK
jgi:hypothetical protein